MLWIIAIMQIFYFSASNCFFQHEFFNVLGLYGLDLDSPFVISQLQLTGAMIMGCVLSIPLFRVIKRQFGYVKVRFR